VCLSGGCWCPELKPFKLHSEERAEQRAEWELQRREKELEVRELMSWSTARLLHWGAGGVTVRTLDLGSKGCDFDFQSGCYQALTTCLLSGKPSWSITSTEVNSAFCPSRVGKSSTGLLSWG